MRTGEWSIRWAFSKIVLDKFPWIWSLTYSTAHSKWYSQVEKRFYLWISSNYYRLNNLFHCIMTILPKAIEGSMLFFILCIKSFQSWPMWPYGLWPARLLCPWNSRLEYWSGWPFPFPGHLPDPGIKPVSLVSPTLAGRFYPQAINKGRNAMPNLVYWKAEASLFLQRSV